MALNLKKNPKIKLHVIKPIALKKQKILTSPGASISVNPEKYMGWKHRQLWRQLPDKEKQEYIKKATQNYCRKQQVELFGKKSIMSARSRRESPVEGPVLSGSSGRSSTSSSSSSSQTATALSESGESLPRDNVDLKEEKNTLTNAVFGQHTGGVNEPVVTSQKVGHAAIRITREISSLITDAGKQQERVDEYKKNRHIQKEVAKQFTSATNAVRAAGKTGSIVTFLSPQLRAVTTAAAPVLLAVVLVFTVIFSLMVTVVGLAAEQASASGGGERIVRVALKEEEEGPQEGGEKYWSWYGFSSRVEWCATFVSWCANQCGYIDSGIVPKSASVSAFHAWYEERGLYFTKEVYTPKAGDFIVFENGMSHIGIVQYVEEGQVITIEGNTSDMVHSRSYPLDWYGISGYCTPKYPADSDFTGDTNAEITWNFLKSKGCSNAAAAGIMGNLQQESGLNPASEQAGGPGRGIAQWEMGSNRFSNLEEKAASMGKEWFDIEPQLEFLWDELSGGDATCKYIMDRDFGGLENFLRTEDVHWATYAFERSFERAGIPAMENRYQFADSFYAQFAVN
ncbi:MAG: CHAP domain-containing protein [Ruminococcus sp.]|nr:CHAP domain-containing protein [Ruminococcus sp.]